MIPPTRAQDAAEGGVPQYRVAEPFLREHKRRPTAARDGIKAWLLDEIAWLESIDRTEHGNGALAAHKDTLRELETIPQAEGGVPTLDGLLREAGAENARLTVDGYRPGNGYWTWRITIDLDGRTAIKRGPTPEAALSAAIAVWRAR